jgi:hypothetical protein
MDDSNDASEAQVLPQLYLFLRCKLQTRMECGWCVVVQVLVSQPGIIKHSVRLVADATEM